MVTLLQGNNWLSGNNVNALKSWVNSSKASPGVIDYSLISIWEFVTHMGVTIQNIEDCKYCKDYPKNVNYFAVAAAMEAAFIDQANAVQTAKSNPTCNVECNTCTDSWEANSECSCKWNQQKCLSIACSVSSATSLFANRQVEFVLAILATLVTLLLTAL